MVPSEKTMRELASRVRELLDLLGDFAHLDVRAYGQHILVEQRRKARARDRDAVARLTYFGNDAFGLSFHEARGGWSEVMLIAPLGELVPVMTDALVQIHRAPGTAAPLRADAT